MKVSMGVVSSLTSPFFPDIHKPVLWLRQDIPRAWFWRTSRRSGSVRNAGDTVRAPRHRAREGALSDRRADVVLHTPLLQEHLTTLIWRGFRRIREDPRSSQREGPRA